jgi:MbtH protein
MSTIQFIDLGRTYRALINEEKLHTPWPSFTEEPSGWRVVRKEDSRAACLNNISDTWTAMRAVFTEARSGTGQR